MKATVTDTLRGAVYGKTIVRLDRLTQEETDELRRALKTVERYKARAFKAAKATKHADWTMIGYAVKTDAVIVTIEQGACG